MKCIEQGLTSKKMSSKEIHDGVATIIERTQKIVKMLVAPGLHRGSAAGAQTTPFSSSLLIILRSPSFTGVTVVARTPVAVIKGKYCDG